jgi:signal transduction histidine kinase
MEAMSETNGRDLAILAHEIREPLASILFAIDFANEAGHDELASRRMCEIVERQARYMAGVIRDVLDASQARHGNLTLHKELIDVCDVVQAAIETNIPQLRKREHSLTLSLPHGALLMIADAQRLQQVVSNLLTNACKYTPPGGRIFVTANNDGDFISIEVRDTGIGLQPESLPRLFDLFHQADEKREPGFSGLGIGLALVKLLVELHDGEITAQSAGRGCGASFTVRLPGAIRVGSAMAEPDTLPRRKTERRARMQSSL